MMIKQKTLITMLGANIRIVQPVQGKRHNSTVSFCYLLLVFIYTKAGHTGKVGVRFLFLMK